MGTLRTVTSRDIYHQDIYPPDNYSPEINLPNVYPSGYLCYVVVICSIQMLKQICMVVIVLYENLCHEKLHLNRYIDDVGVAKHSPGKNLEK